MKTINLSALAQRVYKLTHGALAPLASRAPDAPAAAILAGSVVQDEHNEAAYAQHLHRQALQTLGRATVEEVKESWERKTLVLVDSKLPLPTGEDLAQQVLNRMEANQAETKKNNEELKMQMEKNNEELKTQMVHIQDGTKQNAEAIQAMKTQIQDGTEQNAEAIQKIQASLTQVAIQTAKNANRTLMRLETLVPVPNDHGDIPKGDKIAFPQTYEHLMKMGVRDVNRLLTFYGIHLNQSVTLDQQKELLCRHFGLIPERN